MWILLEFEYSVAQYQQNQSNKENERDLNENANKCSKLLHCKHLLNGSTKVEIKGHTQQ
jgi:hypothetical protein